MPYLSCRVQHDKLKMSAALILATSPSNMDVLKWSIYDSIGLRFSYIHNGEEDIDLIYHDDLDA